MLVFVITLVTITLHSSYLKSRFATVNILGIVRPEAKVCVFYLDKIYCSFVFLHLIPFIYYRR